MDTMYVLYFRVLSTVADSQSLYDILSILNPHVYASYLVVPNMCIVKESTQ